MARAAGESGLPGAIVQRGRSDDIRQGRRRSNASWLPRGRVDSL